MCLFMDKTRTIYFIIFILQFTSCAGLQKPTREPVSLTLSDSGKEKRVVEANPSLYYNYLMAQIYKASGDIEGAIKSYRLAITFDPDSISLMFDLTSLYVRAGRLDEAKQVCMEIIKRNSSHFHAHLLLAGIYSGLNNREAAIEEYETILQQNPGFEEVYIYLNSLYCELKEYEKAKENLKKYTRLRPDSPLPYFYMGRVYSQEEDYKRAEKNYLKALKMDPGHESSLMELSIPGM